MRVCMVVYSFYESDNRVLRYAESLVRRGDDVTVIALRREGQPPREVFNGVNLHRIQKRIKNESRKTTYLARLMKFFAKSATILTTLHLRRPFDFVHVHNMPDFLVFTAFFAKLFGAKVVLDFHDIVPELYVDKFHGDSKSLLYRAFVVVEKVSAMFADHVIVSNHLWDKTLVARSVKDGKCTVILNYPSESIFYKRPRDRNNGRFVIVYPGGLYLRQGVDVAIRAFALIKDRAPFADFHLYGEGTDREFLEALVAGLGLQDRVFFKGYLPIYKIADVVANADLGVEPKKSDVFGNNALSTKIFEFMCLKVPVIASDTAAHRHYFNDSVVKFFKSGDEKELADVLLDLIEKQDKREQLTENALAFVKDYLWELNKSVYLDVVDSLVKGKGQCGGPSDAGTGPGDDGGLA
jgi:glycosyltransferase involved in cell wall biosynthesis